MSKEKDRIQKNRLQRKIRVRSKISGVAKCPRLSVFKSNIGLYAQLIDDESGKTLVNVSLKEMGEKGNKTERSAVAGKLLGKKAVEKGITKAVFDRGGNKYHGRIKAFVEAAREAGLSI